MAITTKQNLDNSKYKQETGSTLDLKGTTHIKDGGKLKFESEYSRLTKGLMMSGGEEVMVYKTPLNVFVESFDEFTSMLNGVLSNGNNTITLTNDIIVTNSHIITYENLTINGNGYKIDFNGENLIFSTNNITFNDIHFVGTKHSAVGSDLIMGLGGGNIYFNYCTFSDLAYNTATPSGNIVAQTAANIILNNCKYINSNNRNNNKLVVEVSNTASFINLSIINFMERHGCDIGIIGSLPNNNMLFLDNSVKVLEGGHFVTWTNKNMIGGSEMSRKGFWKGSLVQYNAISVKDENTIYYIEEDI